MPKNNNFYNCESCQDEPKINCEDCEIPFVICRLDGKIYHKDCIQIISPLPLANINSDDLVETFDVDDDDDIEYLKSLPKESDHHNISDNDREEMFLNFINEMPEGRLLFIYRYSCCVFTLFIYRYIYIYAYTQIHI